MALVQCPDCGQQPSDSAVSCLHCECLVTPPAHSIASLTAFFFAVISALLLAVVLSCHGGNSHQPGKEAAATCSTQGFDSCLKKEPSMAQVGHCYMNVVEDLDAAILRKLMRHRDSWEEYIRETYTAPSERFDDIPTKDWVVEHFRAFLSARDSFCLYVQGPPEGSGHVHFVLKCHARFAWLALARFTWDSPPLPDDPFARSCED